MPDPAEDFEQLTTNLISAASDAGSGLLLRIAAFVLPPVITLIVTQFPRLGQPLSSWLNPLFRVFQ